MKPFKITMQGFRSYREKVELEFARDGLMAIIGDTGAGKSSILEAIVYALYNASSWDERNVRQLLADGETTMRVSLEFEAGGKKYRVTRATSLNSYPPAMHLLEEIDSDLRLDKEMEIRHAIKKIIGLDYEGFRSAVVLPQGQFASLLFARPSEKTSILKGILKLDELDLVREAAYEARTRLTDRLQRLMEKRSKYLLDPVKEQKEAHSERTKLEKEIKKVKKLLTEIKEAEELLRTARTEALRAEEKLQEGAAATLPNAETVFEVEAERKRLLEKEEDLKSELRANIEGSTSKESELQKMPSLETILKELQEGEELATLLSEKREKNLEKTCQLQETKVTVLKRKYEEASTKLENAKGVVAALQEKEHALQLLLKSNEAATKEWKLAVFQLKEAKSKKQELTAEASEAERELSKFGHFHEALATQLQTTLRVGDTCPVCERKIDKLPKSRRSSTGQVEKILNAERKVAATRAALEGVNSRVIGLVAEVSGRKAQIKSGVNKASLVRVFKESKTQKQKVLEFSKVQSERQEELQEEQTKLTELRAEIKAQSVREKRLTELTVKFGLTTRTKVIKRNDFLGSQKEARERIELDLRTLLEREREVREGIAKVLEALQKVDEQISNWRTVLARSEGVYGESFKVTGSSMSEVIEAARSQQKKALEEAEAEAKASRVRVSNAEDRISKVLRSSDMKEREDLEEKHLNLMAFELDARRREERANDERPVVQKLEDQMSPIRERAEAVAEVGNLMADGKFMRYVVAKKERALLGVASNILGEMSGGRLGFGEGFTVVERGSGEGRDPRTLSGGESFLASLSLALSLVEIAGREGGRLQGLFLDEGFGSLDATALDEALTALERVATGGRLVVVVSHLKAIAERVERVMLVQRDVTGSSQVRHLSEEEREAGIAHEVVEQLLH